jgi:hypothetical protein
MPGTQMKHADDAVAIQSKTIPPRFRGAIAAAGAEKFVRLRSNVVKIRQDMLHAAFLLALPVPAMISEAGKFLNLSKNSILQAA